jgi:hypothetical protein
MGSKGRWPFAESAERRSLSALLKWIDQRDAGGFEMPDVAGDHGQTLLQRGGGDQKIGAVMADAGAQIAPSAGSRRVYRRMRSA